MPGTANKTIYSEYWLPSAKMSQDPSLRVTVELRVHEELARFYRQIEVRGLPAFDPTLIRGQWFSYDWDKKSFSGAPSDVPPPEAYMRG